MSGKEKAKVKGPAINAGSKDEEQFIQFVAFTSSKHPHNGVGLMIFQGFHKADQCRGREGEAINGRWSTEASTGESRGSCMISETRAFLWNITIQFGSVLRDKYRFARRPTSELFD